MKVRIGLYTTIILPHFYWCETWSDILREEGRQSLFENMMLRKTPRSKTGGVTGGCGQLRKEEFHDFYPRIILLRVIKSRMVRWAWQMARMVEMINT
jgi:hypothetical protein